MCIRDSDLTVHPTDGVQPSIDREMESVMEGGVVGVAELGIGEPGVENLTIDVDGGQAPSPGSAWLRSRLRHAHEFSGQSVLTHLSTNIKCHEPAICEPGAPRHDESA